MSWKDFEEIDRIETVTFCDIQYPYLVKRGVHDRPPKSILREADATLESIDRSAQRQGAEAMRQGGVPTFDVPDVMLGKAMSLIASRQHLDESVIFSLMGEFAKRNSKGRYPNALSALRSRPDERKVNGERDKMNEEQRELYLWDGPLRLSMLGRWFASGLPAVRVGAKLAASLIFTDYPEDLVDALVPPWPAFALHLPDGFLPYPEVDESCVASVLVHSSTCNGDPSLSALVRSNLGGRFMIQGRSPAVFLRGCQMSEGEDAERALESRFVTTVMRLVVGVCALATDKQTMALDPERARGRSGLARRFSKEPLTTDYVLGADIEVKCDLRDAVREYSQGRSRILRAVQWPVRGHWRNQPCGPRSSERRLAWVRPHWKGPEDALRLVRAHRFQTPGETPAGSVAEVEPPSSASGGR